MYLPIFYLNMLIFHNYVKQPVGIVYFCLFALCGLALKAAPEAAPRDSIPNWPLASSDFQIHTRFLKNSE